MPKKEDDTNLSARIGLLVGKIGGLNVAAEAAQVGRATVQTWRTGKARPPFVEMARLCSAAGVSLEWMATGEGEPDLSSQPRTVWLRVLTAHESGAPMSGLLPTDEFAVHHEFLTSRGLSEGTAAIVRTQGDAMAPDYPEGTLLLLDTRPNVVTEDGYWVMGAAAGPARAASYSFRHVAIENSGLVLTANNKRIRTEVLIISPRHELKVWGKVVWAFVKL
jgi:phage repressor protein C with HTH and peptisase S24 domain